jgi:hypothetical protein
LKEVLADWNLLLAVIGGCIAAVALIAYAFVRPAADPEAEERKRRLHLNLIGRIAEGQVVELSQHSAPPAEPQRGFLGTRAKPLADNRPRSLVSYS